jgi:uncharacterized membrane protein
MGSEGERDAPIELDDAEQTSALERVVFFSDAVFAIAITLLVIDLAVPDLPATASTQDIATALLAIAPRYFAFALSFAVIGAYWLTHWRRFQVISRVDQRLVVLNLALLGSVAFIPFPTALIAQFGDPLTTAIYALAIGVTGLLGSAEWLYAEHAGFIDPRLSPETIRHYLVRGLVVPAVFLASLVVLVLFGARACQLSWIAILVVQAAVSRRYGRGSSVAF